MKLRLAIILFFITTIAAGQGVKVLGPIVTNGLTDQYPTHYDTLSKGGWMSVTTTTKRDAIPTQRRKIGMVVNVGSTPYQLVGGITNADWVQLSLVGNIVATVQTLADLISYTGPAQTVIVKDTLTGGIFHSTYFAGQIDSAVVLPKPDGLGKWQRAITGSIYHSNWFADTAKYKDNMFTRLFNNVPSGAIIIIDKGNYLFNKLITIYDKSFDIEAFGAVLKKDSLTSYHLLQFQQRDTGTGYIHWTGGEFNGNRHYQYSSVATKDTGNYLKIKKDTLPLEGGGNRGLLTIRHYKEASVNGVVVRANAGDAIILGECTYGLIENSQGYDGLPISQTNDRNPLNTGADGYQNTYFKVRSTDYESITTFRNLRCEGGSIGVHYSSDHTKGQARAVFEDIVSINQVQNSIHIEHCKDVYLDKITSRNSLVGGGWFYKGNIQIGAETQYFHGSKFNLTNTFINFNQATSMRECVISDFYIISEDTSYAQDYLIYNPGTVRDGKIEGNWKTGIFGGDLVENVIFQGRDTAKSTALQSVKSVNRCTFDSLSYVGTIIGTGTGDGFFTYNKVSNVKRSVVTGNSRKLLFAYNNFNKLWGKALELSSNASIVEISNNTFVDIAINNDGSRNSNTVLGGPTGTGIATPYVVITNNTFRKTGTYPTATTQALHCDNLAGNMGLTIKGNINADTTTFTYNITVDGATRFCVVDIEGNGSPESVIKGSTGSYYTMKNATIDSVRWVKTGGNSKTGWVPLPVMPVSTGTAAKIGTATLAGGTATITTTAVKAGSVIALTYQNCVNCGTLYKGTITAGSTFTINSTNASDASQVSWEIR